MHFAPTSPAFDLSRLNQAGNTGKFNGRKHRFRNGRRIIQALAIDNDGEQDEEIYIGDTPGKGYSAEGYKGRVIRDNPRKYPSKVDFGFLKGLAGGWAGGEVGLKERDLPGWAAQNFEPISDAKGDFQEKILIDADTSQLQEGCALVYIGDTPGKGYSVEGYKGRFIQDDPSKYPSKVDYGVLRGLAGGWAGGEVGLKERDLPGWAADLEGARLDATLARGSGIISSDVCAPPILMPGMDVMIDDVGSQYHLFRGVLQRVSDGRAAVLFEGGNWDKLVTFDISQLNPAAGDA